MLLTAAMPANAPTRKRSAAITHQRRDTRSTSAPTNGPRMPGGRSYASSTAVIAHGEGSRSYAITNSATVAAPVPSDDCA